MVKDAEANKEEDKKKREEIDAKNSADSLVASTEQSLKEHGDKVSAEDKKTIETDLQSLKDAIKSENVEDIKTKTQTDPSPYAALPAEPPTKKTITAR